MITASTKKYVAITPPAAIVDAASYTTTSVDTKGFKKCRIVAFIGATDIAMTALKVQESDDNSSFADITGATFTTLPSATNDNTFWAIDINMDGSRKRYLDLVATAGDGAAGTYLAAWAELSGAEEMPNSSSEQGLADHVTV